MTPKFLETSAAILQDGRKRFAAMMGIVSRIHDTTYEVVAVSSYTGIPSVGDRYDLNAVYCREVVEKKRTVAITEVDGEPGMRLHPLYDSIPCEFYISTPIVVAGEVWGTLNFTSFEKRELPFDTNDIAFVEEQAARLGQLIAASA